MLSASVLFTCSPKQRQLVHLHVLVRDGEKSRERMSCLAFWLDLISSDSPVKQQNSGIRSVICPVRLFRCTRRPRLSSRGMVLPNSCEYFLENTKVNRKQFWPQGQRKLKEDNTLGIVIAIADLSPILELEGGGKRLVKIYVIKAPVHATDYK